MRVALRHFLRDPEGALYRLPRFAGQRGRTLGRPIRDTVISDARLGLWLEV